MHFDLKCFCFSRVVLSQWTCVTNNDTEQAPVTEVCGPDSSVEKIVKGYAPVKYQDKMRQWLINIIADFTTTSYEEVKVTYITNIGEVVLVCTGVVYLMVRNIQVLISVD